MADITSLIARGPAKLDFSSIMNLPDAFAKGQAIGADYRARQALSGGLPRAADGSIDFAAAADMLARAGDKEGAIGLIKGQVGNVGAYGTPIYGQDAQGNTVVQVITKGGQLRTVNNPGVTQTPGVRIVDTGPAYQPVSTKTGAPQGGAIPKQGEVPTGYQPQIGPGGVTATPIPGTPQAQKEQEQRISAVQKDETTLETARLVKQSIQDARDLVSKAPFYNPAVGFGTGVTERFRGSNATNLKAITETIRSNIGFDRLQRMRDESPTGGALGSVAIQELAALQASLGNLENSQSQDQFLKNLERVEKIYDNIIRKASAYPNAAKYGFAPPQAALPQSAPGAPQGLPQGARQAADGNYYVPDPNRPGKYLMVQP
jgi:hypothetical protein